MTSSKVSNKFICNKNHAYNQEKNLSSTRKIILINVKRKPGTELVRNHIIFPNCRITVKQVYVEQVYRSWTNDRKQGLKTWKEFPDLA